MTEKGALRLTRCMRFGLRPHLNCVFGTTSHTPRTLYAISLIGGIEDVE